MASSLMFRRRGRSVGDFLVGSPRAKLSHPRPTGDLDEAHQSIYRRNVKAAGRDGDQLWRIESGICGRT